MSTATQALVVLPPTGLAVPSSYDETGLSDVARLKPTKMTMIQNTTRDKRGGKAGQFLDDLTGAIYDSLTIVPLKVTKPRAMFPPGSNLDTPPICKSDDGIVPSRYIENPQSANCYKCPQSQWVNGKPSPCRQKRQVLFVMRETGLPRYLQVPGDSVPIFQNALDNIMQDVHINKLKGKKLELYDYVITMKSREKSNARGVFYILDINPATDIKQVATPSEFGPLFEEFVLRSKGYAQQEEVKQIEAKNEAAVDAAVNDVITAEFVDEGV